VSELPVALDAMGGDSGSAPNVLGAAAAIREDGASVVLVGDEASLQSAIDKAGARDLVTAGRLSVVHASEVVSMDDKPAVAARQKKQSSMRIACNLVDEDKACGAMSAGNSGAMLATALLVFSRVHGVMRPAIGTMLPTLSPIRTSMLVDAGANTDCTPVHLVQWALLGASYVEHVHGMQRPPVALVSNGEEDTKGTDMLREALALLRQTDLNVTGFIEGRHLNTGETVVFVTDGFTGNVMLKTAEGVFKFVKDQIKKTYESGNALEKLGGLLSKSVFERMSHKLDPREVGAAPLLGLARPAFIAHGSADAYAIRRGIGAVRAYAKNDVTAHMKDAIARHAHLFPTCPARSHA
jgi:phosphate acyltransferase